MAGETDFGALAETLYNTIYHAHERDSIYPHLFRVILHIYSDTAYWRLPVRLNSVGNLSRIMRIYRPAA